MSRGSELEGYCIDLVSELSKKLGFKYKLHLVKDNRYGAMDSSSNWNGMIGEIIRRVSQRPLNFTGSSNVTQSLRST